MAPEQFREVFLTPATDVFACGVVLFQALTGKLPFRSLRRWNKGTLLRDPNEVPLRAIQVAPSIPRQIDDFIARCLDSNPGRRYRNGGKALEALHRALQLGGGSATYSFPPPIHQVPGHCRSDH
jgi:serine/threonine-protein kinase